MASFNRWHFQGSSFIYYRAPVVLKIYPTHLEINFLPDPDDAERLNCPIENTFTEIWKTVHSGIKRGNLLLTSITSTVIIHSRSVARYGIARSQNSIQRKCFKENCAVKKVRDHVSFQRDMTSGCLKIPQLKHDCITVEKDGDVQCNNSHFIHLYDQLSSHAAKWKDIGTSLKYAFWVGRRS